MQNPRVDLSGCTTIEEAEAEVAALITERQEDILSDYEAELIDIGVARNDIDAELERRRGELEVVRAEMLVRLRGFVRRGGQKLQ